MSFVKRNEQNTTEMAGNVAVEQLGNAALEHVGDKVEKVAEVGKGVVAAASTARSLAQRGTSAMGEVAARQMPDFAEKAITS